jgi:hypothetical protein
VDSRLDSRLVWIMEDMDVLIEWFADSIRLLWKPLSLVHRLSLWLDAHRKV